MTSVRTQRVALIAAALVAFVGLVILARAFPVEAAVERLRAVVAGHGVLGFALFVVAYVVLGLLFVPGAAITLAVGGLFGVVVGTVLVSIASTITAALAFLIARHLIRGRVERWAASRPRFAAIDRAIASGGWKVVALLRLSPAVPFSVGNYLYGLTAIDFVPYVIASWVFMLPGTLLYVYLGHVGAAGLAAASGSTESADRGRIALLVAGLIATIVVTVWVTRLARRTLAERGALAPTNEAEDVG